ncbi:alpha/beta hydrolase [Bifidobacterium dolichotidis]|uniref:alpha/beta hydrolase n=1 Tax=Bifidobacterium dolichotidis TaxID=2306976 RepID=UPI001F496F38|nr:alpha/beta hydrolase-fold protein [Bifidobacterium dolichotidis]
MHITDGWLPALLFWLCVGLVVLLIVTQLGRGTRDAVAVQAAHESNTPHHKKYRSPRHRLVLELIIAVITGLVGFGIAAFLSEVINAFGVSLGWEVIRTIGLGLGVVGFGVAALIFARRWRKIFAALLVVVSLLTTAMGVNMIYGEYKTIGSIFNYDDSLNFSSADLRVNQAISVEEWKQEHASGRGQHYPDEGRRYTVNIPNTASGFHARKAIVWLPPAAFAARPPKLPVMVMLAGNPGSPGRYFQASNTVSLLEQYAKDHYGMAPIVVSPDQNGSDQINSLCADTATHGKAETYLTVDVPNWIKQHLPVEDAASQWTIGGFSQGGTCAVQLGPNHPNLFSYMVPVDTELEPTNGTVEKMVAQDFAGDRAAFERQIPTNAFRRHATPEQTLIIGAGAEDAESINNMITIGRVARESGVHVTELISRDAGHTWKAVNQVFAWALPWIATQQGLGDHAAPITDYPALEERQ